MPLSVVVSDAAPATYHVRVDRGARFVEQWRVVGYDGSALRWALQVRDQPGECGAALLAIHSAGGGITPTFVSGDTVLDLAADLPADAAPGTYYYDLWTTAPDGRKKRWFGGRFVVGGRVSVV